MAKANRLTKRAVEAATRPGLHGDGATLFLRVRDGGSKQWIQIVHVKGKRIVRGLGGYPLVSLEEAREIAFANRRALKRGENPFAAQDALREQLAAEVSGAPTFLQALDAVIAIQRPSWKVPADTEYQWRQTLETYAGGLMAKPVDAIGTPEVLAALTPIWDEIRPTAGKVKQRISAVMKWAVAHGHRMDNPVSAVDAVLPKNGKKATEHHKALPYAEVPQAIAKMEASTATLPVKLAFRFLVLTATRSNEVLGATWKEIDLDAATWTIPAERMKAGVEHVVPLSEPAMAVLNEAAAELGKFGPIFPSQSPRAKGRELARHTLSRVPRDLNLDATIHGFRSSFRNWAAENDYEHDVAEAALAHKERNAVVAAYKRTSYLEKRREMMAAWAAHCEPSKGAMALARKRARQRNAG